MWWYNNNTSQRKLGSFALYESPTSYALSQEGALILVLLFLKIFELYHYPSYVLPF